MDDVVGIGKEFRAQDNTPRLCIRYHEIQRWSIRGTWPSLEKRRDINLKINDLPSTISHLQIGISLPSAVRVRHAKTRAQLRTKRRPSHDFPSSYRPRLRIDLKRLTRQGALHWMTWVWVVSTGPSLVTQMGACSAKARAELAGYIEWEIE